MGNLRTRPKYLRKSEDSNDEIILDLANKIEKLTTEIQNLTVKLCELKFASIVAPTIMDNRKTIDCIGKFIPSIDNSNSVVQMTSIRTKNKSKNVLDSLKSLDTIGADNDRKK